MVDSPHPILYLHVADDGGILAIEGTSGRSSWITVSQLKDRLHALERDGGSVLLSHESGSNLSLPVVDLIRRSSCPAVMSREIHPDALRPGGLTALMSAAYVGALDHAADLIERGVDASARDNDGCTALMYAASAGQEDLVKLLIQTGINPDQSDEAGSTPLMFAAENGHGRVVKALIAAGASVDRQRHDAMTAWDIAARNGHSQVAAFIAAVREKP